MALGGCYLSGGLGSSGGGVASAHLGGGLAFSIGSRGAVTAGAGVAIGRYTEEAKPLSAIPGYAHVGGVASLVGKRHTLAALLDVSLPFGGRLTNFEGLSDPADVWRIYGGVGYRWVEWRDWRAGETQESVLRAGISVTATFGPEVLVIHDDVHPPGTTIGAAADVTAVFPGWRVKQMFECAMSDKDDEPLCK